ncbi:hypothetical protein ACWDSL_40775 [Streptomyces sp. NPDC000941]
MDEFLEEEWVDRHTRRFVERVERVAGRNNPLSAEHRALLQTLADAGVADVGFFYERDDRWRHEDQLVQGDYDVWVRDSRWLSSLYVGQSWGTTSYETEADFTPEEVVARIPGTGPAPPESAAAKR